jgi:hypothetical protein
MTIIGMNQNQYSDLFSENSTLSFMAIGNSIVWNNTYAEIYATASSTLITYS